MAAATEFSVLKLYRDCLRTADYISSRSGIANQRASLWNQVRTAFRNNINEKDEKKIAEQKEAAVRGLSNYMFHEAQRMAKEDQAKGNPDLTKELDN